MTHPLRELLSRRILVLDGAMGTELQALGLRPEDFGGASHEGCNEHLVFTRPDIVRAVHASYLEAGADIIETNTFGALRHVLAEYGLAERAAELARTGASLAAAEARRFHSPDKPRFVAGSLGPGTKSISLTGGIGFDEVRRNYAEAARALVEGGADLILLETQQDTLNAKASLLGIRDACEALGRAVPTAVSVSIESTGTMLAGQSLEAFYLSVEHLDLLAVGMNCATGPDFMSDHLRSLAGVSRLPILCFPNAGLPDEHGRYLESPVEFGAKLRRFCEQGWVHIAGGCCGTTPEHIRALAAAVKGVKPRPPAAGPAASLSGLEPLFFDPDRRPVLIGERTNVIGSKKFRELVAADDFDAAAETGRQQARLGAQVIDVCLANPDRDERADMGRLLDTLAKKVKIPFMIDSTDPAVVEEALKRCQGKAVINSVNLEEGEGRLRRIVPLARSYGAALVVGMIDEDKQAGMGVTRERKLAIARRSHELLTGKYGMRPEDLYLDPLTFPCATGDKAMAGSAVETIEALRLIKAEFPRVKTLLGVSNVSFGLPKAGREVLNAVFLHHCVEAGLDLAIVNVQGLARYATLPEEERRLAERLLFEKDPPVAEFANRYRNVQAKAEEKHPFEGLSAEERLFRKVVEGSKEALIGDLDGLLKTRGPLEIINGPLLRGMAEVGRLFGDNKMIVAEVLQSAEVMRASAAHLEGFMDKGSAAAKGKLLLATVKGDVHDIGKNLVHIIFANNGYEVLDLGIKIAPEALIQEAKRFGPDLIGLSGLLVKSAQQMASTAEDLASAGIQAPILVGGAALTPRFTANRIAPKYEGPVFYAKDAMAGLALAEELRDAGKREERIRLNDKRQKEFLIENDNTAAENSSSSRAATAALEDIPNRPGNVIGCPGTADKDVPPIPQPPDLKMHVLTDIRLDDIFKYLNPLMLYGKHLGLKGNLERLLAADDPKAVELHKKVTALQEEAVSGKLIVPKGLFRFFPARSEGDDIVLYDSPSGGKALERLHFPRKGSCLADYLASDRMDYLALFVVTCGHGVAARAASLREAGELLKSHALSALAIESAEAFAELLHERIRAMWGFSDAPDLSLRDKFQARYRGKRYSLGYPACPNIEDQAKLWRLLEPDRLIDVRLTEGFMMEPEASVSAMVFHHPEARYFSV
ncbi:MAG: methionine synthase [Elusimicrobiota bacterium]